MDLSLRQAVTRRAFRALNVVVMPVVKTGLFSPLPFGFGLVVLETIGRRSGLPREVPLVSARRGETLVVSTVRNPSQWVENAAAAGSARVWVGGTSRAGKASIRRGLLQVVVLDLHDESELAPAIAC